MSSESFDHESQQRSRPDWSPVGAASKSKGTVSLPIAAKEAGMPEGELQTALEGAGYRAVLEMDGVAYFDTTDVAKYLAKRDLDKRPRRQKKASGLSKPKGARVRRPGVNLY